MPHPITNSAADIATRCRDNADRRQALASSGSSSNAIDLYRIIAELADLVAEQGRVIEGMKRSGGVRTVPLAAPPPPPAEG